MAKGNGTTRGSNPRSMYGGEASAQDSGLTQAQYQGFVNEIARGEYPAGWDDLDADHRLLALMEGGFTGLANDDASDVIFSIGKEEAIGEVVNALVNEYYNGPDADQIITIGYLDGSRKEVGGIGSDIELKQPLTRNQIYRTQERIVRSSLNTKNIAYVIETNPSRSTVWAAPNKGMAELRKYTGMEVWRKGRGEKRRDYIQDDWI